MDQSSSEKKKRRVFNPYAKTPTNKDIEANTPSPNKRPQNNQTPPNSNNSTGTTNSIQAVHIATSHLQRDATRRGRSSAMKCFQKFQTNTGVDLFADLEEAEDDETKSEAVLDYIMSFSLWLKKHPVGAQGKEKALSNNTVGQYFGQVKEIIKDATQSLKLWINHEEVWYSKLLNSVKSAYSSSILEGDLQTRDPTCRAIHLKCTKGKLMQMQREWNDSEGADIDSILKSLMKGEFNNRNCHEDRLKILLVYYVVGRGGELKFLRHDHSNWDYYANSIQSILTRIKTRSQHFFWIQCAPFSPTNYRIDFLHAFGQWASVGDGLFRLHPEANGAGFWFPSMRKQKNEIIARDITALLKKNVAGCLVPSTSSRGIRVGANTDLAMNANISNEEQRQASGHSGSVNTEIYIRMNPDLGIPASLALSGWENIRKVKTPPTLEALPLTEEQVECLLDELFTVSLPMFKQGGCMRVLLRHATASLIMYHPYYIRDFDELHFKLPKRLMGAIENCGFSNESSILSQTLNKFSTLIRDRFISENNLISKTGDSDATIMTLNQTINNQSILINKLVIQNANHASEIRSLTSKMESQDKAQQQSFSALNDAFVALNRQHDLSQQILKQIGYQTDDFISHSAERRATKRDTNLSSPFSLPRKDLLKELEMQETHNSADDDGDSLANPPQPISFPCFMEQFENYIPKDTVLLNTLTWNDFAIKKSNKGLEIREILLNLLNTRLLEGIFKYLKILHALPG